MSDDKTKRRPQDASKINMHEDYEVAYWTAKWNVTRAQLQAAVTAVGVGTTKVAAYLGKSL